MATTDVTHILENSNCWGSGLESDDCIHNPEQEKSRNILKELLQLGNISEFLDLTLCVSLAKTMNLGRACISSYGISVQIKALGSAEKPTTAFCTAAWTIVFLQCQGNGLLVIFMPSRHCLIHVHCSSPLYFLQTVLLHYVPKDLLVNQRVCGSYPFTAVHVDTSLPQTLVVGLEGNG